MTELITPVPRSVISSPDTQAAIWFLGALSQVRLNGEQTGGAFSLADNLARRGNASHVHVRDRDDETFFVLDGELRVFAGGDDYAAGPGTVAFLPRRLRHAYVTSATARFLALHAPAGSLGLEGEASPAGFQAMFEGRDPTTGELLGRPHGRNAVPPSTRLAPRG